MSANTTIENLKKRIAGFQGGAEMFEYGTVMSISDGIAKISGLSKCQSSEMISFESGAVGLALNLEEDSVGAIVLGDFSKIKEACPPPPIVQSKTTLPFSGARNFKTSSASTGI